MDAHLQKEIAFDLFEFVDAVLVCTGLLGRGVRRLFGRLPDTDGELHAAADIILGAIAFGVILLVAVAIALALAT